MKAKAVVRKRPAKATPKDNGLRFEAAKLDSLFEVLDAVAWMGSPTCKQTAQFAGVDPRTAGKLLKNGLVLGVLECLDGSTYLLPLLSKTGSWSLK
jgi:hypothetical protein